MTADPMQAISIKQQIRERVLPQIRKYEEEQSWWRLAEDARYCELAEVDASNAIIEVRPKVEEIVNKSSANYPDDLMRKLQEILDTLNEQQTPAAAKLIAAVHLIPGILSCEMELGTEISFTSVFEGIKQLLKKNSTNRVTSSTHTTSN
ncbi:MULTISPECIES: hypothetical protein [unclassified Microcoleus]|uniref:hypothetical protein n=1 Tax=unclassified Microcoleus TaxID=2642155 RepID=UPI002FD0164D